MLSSGVFPAFPKDSRDHVVLLIIDPQVDFHEGGSLAVAGATADAQRIKKMMENIAPTIGQVFVTMDSHHRNHIAHASFWFTEQQHGDHVPLSDAKQKPPTKYSTTTVFEPAPFTVIKQEHVGRGKWQPVDQSLMDHCVKYTRDLESSRNRMSLIIWPEHCLIGRPGHCVQPDVYEGIKAWEERVSYRRSVYYVYKGFNNLTEMYSAIRAEVAIENDPSTQTNYELLEYLWKASKVIVCGQARSHCVNFTVRDIVEDWMSRTETDDETSRRQVMSKLILLDDGMSDVGSFEPHGDTFFSDMETNFGVSIHKCEDLVMEGHNRLVVRPSKKRWVPRSANGGSTVAAVEGEASAADTNVAIDV